ncbi:MAG: phosphatidylglycerophosphatase A [Planctomycetes bacterium]|nr:phosphatidylglycerophosphatase A [Planctomycetota bacterium]
MRLVKLGLVTCGFLGLAPFAPGTFGTLGGVAIAWALRGTDGFLVWTLLVAAALYALGRALGPWAEAHAGRKDPGFFVLDEVVGYLVTVAWLEGPSLLALLTAFCAFRLFDILKPPPIRRFERVGGGDGIMLDDVVAGVYGLVLVMLPARLLIDAPWSVGA